MGDIRPIDEVIEALSICRNVDPYRVCRECPYPDTEGCMDMLMGDALFYMKALRDAKDTLEREKERYQEAVKNCEKAENKYYMLCELNRQPNDPLTWDELKTTEGKPVWVEQCNGDTKGWLLILRTNYDVINCTTKHGNSFYLYKSSYGEKWQAYRKERE